MGPLDVVEVQIPAERCAGLGDAVIGLQIDFLVFDRAPEPFDEDVVAPGALAVHADRAPWGLLGPAWSSARSLPRSSVPSQRATTRVATPLPITLVRARHSLMNRSTPKMSAMAATGIVPTAPRVSARVMKPAPATPLAPLEVSMAAARSTSSWVKVRWVLVAWARNSVARVM